MPSEAQSVSSDQSVDGETGGVVVLARCLVCGQHDALASKCLVCDSPYHGDCGRYAKRCALYGCDGQIVQTSPYDVVASEAAALSRRIGAHHRLQRQSVFIGITWLTLSYFLGVPILLLAVATSDLALGLATTAMLLIGPIWCIRLLGKANAALREQPNSLILPGVTLTDHHEAAPIRYLKLSDSQRQDRQP